MSNKDRELDTEILKSMIPQTRKENVKLEIILIPIAINSIVFIGA